MTSLKHLALLHDKSPEKCEYIPNPTVEVMKEVGLPCELNVYGETYTVEEGFITPKGVMLFQLSGGEYFEVPRIVKNSVVFCDDFRLNPYRIRQVASLLEPRPQNAPLKYSAGTLLRTKDGRSCGNAVIASDWKEGCDSVFILTDFGNVMKMSPSELDTLFYYPQDRTPWNFLVERIKHCGLDITPDEY